MAIVEWHWLHLQSNRIGIAGYCLLMTRLPFIALAVTGALLAGCASSSKTDSAATASAEPVNTVCPIGGHDVPNNELTAVHKGHVIAFCCEGCAASWALEDEAGKDEILAIALGENSGG